jgi:hypothetical protein
MIAAGPASASAAPLKTEADVVLGWRNRHRWLLL